MFISPPRTEGAQFNSSATLGVPLIQSSDMIGTDMGEISTNTISDNVTIIIPIVLWLCVCVCVVMYRVAQNNLVTDLAHDD